MLIALSVEYGTLFVARGLLNEKTTKCQALVDKFPARELWHNRA